MDTWAIYLTIFLAGSLTIAILIIRSKNRRIKSLEDNTNRDIDSIRQRLCEFTKTNDEGVNKSSKFNREQPVLYSNNPNYVSNELKNLLDKTEKNYELLSKEIELIRNRIKDLLTSSDDTVVTNGFVSTEELLEMLTVRTQFLEKTNSNLKMIPYMSSIMADYETIGLETLASKLSWGRSQERAKKVASIRQIRKETADLLNAYKQAQYQLNYLLELYPGLNDIIECELGDIPQINTDEIPDYDYVRNYITKEEYQQLSTTERNQLALDRYINSHNKTKWQIGRDYELYVGYRYTQKGYRVDYFGSNMKLEDMGRDLICKRGDKTLIIQCKYWSSLKEIHEKHIMQLYGTTISYCLENNLNPENVNGVFVTNISLSPTARKIADYLKIECVENFERGDYPRIKCNLGHDEFGNAKIYHLPFDQQYDMVKIDKPGEFWATTVREAERAGFRRAYKWHNA